MADCPLLELPFHLLYKISRSLDLASQRSLFLSSTQLYSKWNLHIPTEDRHWQFVRRCTELLAQTTPDLACSADSCATMHFEETAPWTKITRRRQPQGTSWRYDLAQSEHRHPPLMTNAKYCTDLTQDQLWHRLAASPKLANATVTLKTDVDATELQQQAFAKQSFEFLCTTRGFLTFFMFGLDGSHEAQLEPGYHAVKVLHAVAHGQEYWEIDGERCIISPPKFDFDKMPGWVVEVHAQFVSEGPPAQEYLAPDDPEVYFFPDNQLINDFFYQGNVDIDAWVEKQHEVGNEWFDHMDDFMEEEDFDDMHDLDDADMAQLLGAMQG